MILTGDRGDVLNTGAQAVLILEDDAMARSVIAEIVDMAGFRAIPAGTAEAALGVLESTRVCAVLSDIRIPDTGSGIDFIRTVMRRWPEIPLAVVTGYPYDLAPLQSEDDCPALIIHKPFHVSQIMETLRLVAGFANAISIWSSSPIL